MPTNIFISYANEDVEYLRELEAHLSLLKREGTIKTWHLGCVAPGTHWESELRSQLDSAQVVIALISADFFASNQCCEVELQHAAHRAAFGQATLIPILLRACLWKSDSIKHARIFPRSGLPLGSSPNRDEAWTEVAQEVLAAVCRFDEQAELMAQRHRTFFRTPNATNSFSFARVCVNPSDEHWSEATTPLMAHPSPFGTDIGQYVFLRDLFNDETGTLGLSLDVTVMNKSTAPLVLTKIGMEIIAVAHIPEAYGDGTPTKIPKTDLHVLELPNVREMLNSKFPDLGWWEPKGPVVLDLHVSTFLPDPILLPPGTPYRYGFSLANYVTKMPNHSLIRAWALTSDGAATSNRLHIFTS